jgi:cell division protein FtsW
MAKKLSTDRTLFAIAIALLGLGLVMVWSASSALVHEKHGSPYHLVVRQSVCAAIGLALLFACMRLDYRKLNRPKVVYSVAIVTTLLLMAVLFLPPVNEARRWIRLAGLSFQPSELAKLATVLFLAYHVDRKGDRINELVTSVVPAALLLGWFAYLIAIEPDLGTAATVVLIGCVMLYLAGLRPRYFAVFGVAGVLFLCRGIYVMAYRRERIEAFLNPFADARGSGYQIIQSLIAVGTGGVTGVGLMDGQQKLSYLPYPSSDFIYAVIGEELGLIGAMAVVAAFLLLLWRGVRSALRAPDRFGMYLAGGLTCAIVIQALTNVSVVLGLLPTKGIPLPFVSAGGTALILTLLATGIVLSVSQHAD